MTFSNDTRKWISLMTVLLPLLSMGAINNAEYYFDTTDNGPGLNPSMSVSVSNGIATATASGISTVGLSPGIHMIYSRLYDDAYGWGEAQGRPFLITSAQTVYSITQAEYYLDDGDNGFGNNNALNLNLNNGVATATASGISLSDLDAGVHVAYARFFAENQGWGPVQGYPFFITTAQTEYSISAGEYFIDENDLGAGNNSAMSLSTSNGQVTGTANSISTTGLSSGLHIIYSRMYAAGVGWGPVQGYPFAVSQSTGTNTITAAEYYIDTDPGFGSATALTLGGSATNVSVQADFDLDSASPGLHWLYLRLFSPEAGWGPASKALFHVSSEGTINFIQAAQYYIGTSLASATIVNIESPQDGTFDELNEAIALTDVAIPDGATGLQTVGLRFQQADGQWGAWRTTQFLVLDESQFYTIMGAEYFLDVDPGPGSGTPIEAPLDGNYDEKEEEFDLPISVEGLEEGGHVAYLRLKRSDGTWGAARGSYFIVSEDAQPTIAGAEYFVNPATPEGGGIPFTPLDGAFNTTEESVSAIANLASLNAQAEGNYTLYVRFMNSRGEWGDVTGRAFTVETRPQLATSVDTLDFGSLFTGESRILDITISNIGDADLLITAMDFSDAAYSSAGFTGSIAPLGSETISIEFAPTDPAASHPATLTIANNDADKQIVLQGIGLDTAPIMSVSLDSLEFGTVQTIASSSLSVRVSNLGNEDLVLSGVTSTDPAFSGSIPNPTVVPNEYVDVDIIFAPSIGQSYADTVYLISNDTYFPSYPIFVSGIGSVVPVPNINLSSESLDFGNIALEDAPTTLNLIIHNAGTASLNISNVSIDEPAFITTLSAGTSINPSGSQSVSVSFTPTESKRYHGTMVIYNDDPDAPEVSIDLLGSSVFPDMVLSSNTFNFGDVGVTTSATQSLIITNIGSDTLKIMSFEASSGLDSVLSISPASFNLNPSGGLRNFSLTFRPSEPVDYQGTVVIHSNDDADTLFILGTGIDDEPPEIVFDPALLEDIGTTENTAIAISAPISDNNQIAWVRLFYRQGGKSHYDSTNMALSAGVYRGEIPPAYVRNRGVEYYIKAFDGANTQVIPATAPEVPAIIRVRLPSLPPFTFTAETYGMISVPSDLDQKHVRTILEGDIGTYDVFDWRLFRWINGSYVELSENDNFSFEPGNAYWLITADRQVITLDSSTSVKTNQEYLISLDQGWNQVGTPYYFPVAWSDVYAASPGVIQGSIAYAWVDNEWQPASLMEPFGGYFISAASGGSILRIPPRETVAAAAKINGEPFDLLETEWVIKVGVDNGLNRDRFNYLGVLQDAQLGLDIQDQPKPPPMYPDQLQIYSEHRSWNSPITRFSGDFQGSSEQGNYWDLTLYAGASEADIEMSLESTGNIPQDYSIRVLNLDLRYELPSSESEMHFVQKYFGSDRSYQIRVLVGSDEFLRTHDEGIGESPTDFRLSQNYPNPFNGETHLEFDIPEPAPLRIVVYDVRGRLIRELIRSDLHPVGFHEVAWNGRDNMGRMVASGIYLVSIQTPGFQTSRKVVLLK